MRRGVSRKLDRWMFKKTSSRTKKINVSPVMYRGGIRL